METLASISAKTRRAYNLVAERYHELFHDEMKQKDHDRAVLDSFAKRFTSRSVVCDAGCGPSGHIGRYLFDNGIPVMGVDISERCVELARLHNPEMRFELGDLSGLPFEDASFDGIISYYSIINTPKRYVDDIFREFHRVLGPGGSLLVVVKAGATEGYVDELLGTATEIYFTLFSEQDLAGYFERTAFELEFLETRPPYEFEIDSERIYAIGRKRN